MGCFASTPEPPRYATPARAVQAGRAMPQPGAYSNYYAQAEAAFRAGDANGDGVLDAQELYMVLVRLGFFNGVPPQNVQAMMEEQMARADSSVRDRKVTFDEFVPYFEYLMHQLAQRGVVQQPAAPAALVLQPGPPHALHVALQQTVAAEFARPTAQYWGVGAGVFTKNDCEAFLLLHSSLEASITHECYSPRFRKLSYYRGVVDFNEAILPKTSAEVGIKHRLLHTES